MKRWPDEDECAAYNSKTKTWRIAGSADEDGKLCTKSAGGDCKNWDKCKSYRDWFLERKQ